MAKLRAEVTVHGRVQGVGFRFSTVSQAQHLGLTGWVRNTWEGAVEAVFEGEEKAVRAMVDWCRRGPTFARVRDVDVRCAEATGEFAGFHVTG